MYSRNVFLLLFACKQAQKTFVTVLKEREERKMKFEKHAVEKNLDREKIQETVLVEAHLNGI